MSKTGTRSDARATATIAGAGWTLTRIRENGEGRFVARKRITEADDSETKRFESSYTLERLAKQVERREREERYKGGRS
jgi:hypothetical protein